MSDIAPLGFTPRAVLFDMDGLMLDSERALTDCLAQAATTLGHTVPDALWLQMIGGSTELCRALLSACIGEEACDAVLARAHADYDAIVDAGVPHRPGVIALLDWLQACGIPRAVGTSTRRPLAVRKLAAAGLAPYFAAVCTSSDVAQPKPAPDIYLLAASKLGVKPADCLVLEDSPTGVRAAFAAGMTPVQIPDMLVPDDDTRALGHRILPSLQAAQALLESSLSP